MKIAKSEGLTPKQREALGALAMGLLTFVGRRINGAYRMHAYLNGVDVTHRIQLLKRKGCVAYRTARITGRDGYGHQVVEHQQLGYEITEHGRNVLWPPD